MLFRALNLKLGERLLDLSAGGGIDSFIIANFGFEVLMIERHWVIYLLLKDALRRLRTLNRFKDLQLNLAFGEAVNYLDKSYPVVYFDLMFPKQNKSALNRQKMRFLGDLVGSDSDADQVARLALQKTHRLVIKRPRSVTPLLLDPALTYTGKSHRFDVYFN